MKEFNFNELKEAIKHLNESGLLSEKMKTIGVGKDNLIEHFATAVEKLSEEGKELPTQVVDFYNKVFVDEADAPEAAAAAAEAAPAPEAGTTPLAPEAGKKEKKEKKEKKARTPKEPKPKKVVPVSRYGHKEGSQSAIMDDMLWAGAKVLDIAAKLNVKTSRVANHIAHLQKDKKLTVIKDDEGVYKVKEETLPAACPAPTV